MMWLRYIYSFVIVAFLTGTAYSAEPVEFIQGNLKVGTKTYYVSGVKADLQKVTIKVGLAQGKVGLTEDLAAIAGRHKALAAINGSFFDAYTKDPIKNPHHTLFTDSKLMHLGNIGSLFTIDTSNNISINHTKLKIIGSRNGRYTYPDFWYAYWINRKSSDATVTIFTRDWGTVTGISDGQQIVVSDGIVTAIGTGSQHIPENGFVIYVKNIYDTTFDRFRVGQEVSYKVVHTDNVEKEFNAKEAVGAGPWLLNNGEVVYNPQSEGFTNPKILTETSSRSAIGITSDNQLLLVVTTSTVRELADIMKALGARDAMNLDGGASSSLWYAGKYIRTPGRQISNALMVIDKAED